MRRRRRPGYAFLLVMPLPPRPPAAGEGTEAIVQHALEAIADLPDDAPVDLGEILELVVNARGIRLPPHVAAWTLESAPTTAGALRAEARGVLAALARG